MPGFESAHYLQHPCRVTDADGDRQQAWGKSSGMANGYRGPSLATLVQHGKAILKPLAHVHRQGVLHRGLTPDHILVRAMPHCLSSRRFAFQPCCMYATPSLLTAACPGSSSALTSCKCLLLYHVLCALCMSCQDPVRHGKQSLCDMWSAKHAVCQSADSSPSFWAHRYCF